jgi:regulator of RNase E activity RraB
MGLFDKFKRGRDNAPVDLDERSPRLGVKYRDLMVMDQVAKRAEDMSAPRHVVFHLYATSPQTGRALAAEARGRGFEAAVREPLSKYPDSWAVTCQTHAVLTPDFVRENVDFFEALADRHKAEYDGWEAAV